MFYIIKFSIIIAAVLSFLTFMIDSISHSRGSSVSNIFLKSDSLLCVFIIICSIYFGDTIFSLKKQETVTAIILLALLVITFYYKFILGCIKTKRINDAILYGIKGTYWVKYYDDNYGKVYLVRRYTQQHDFYQSSSEENNEKNFDLLDLYENDTHNYVCTISEELLWDMIRPHKDKNKGTSLFRTFKYYRILYPTLQYTAYKINKTTFKERILQYEQTHNTTIEYDFVYSEGEERLMIYNTDVKSLKKDMPSILAKVLEV